MNINIEMDMKSKSISKAFTPTLKTSFR